MNLDAFRQRFPDEAACRKFFETMIWPDGRTCPHCGDKNSWVVTSQHARPGLYHCRDCSKQFTVTTKTPLHSTKLSLWHWLMVMYYMVHSSKGVSSVFMARWIGISQKSSWKMMHAVRSLMSCYQQTLAPLQDVVEVDEKYVGGTPRYQHGKLHKRGRGTAKSCVLVAVQRRGPVRTKPIKTDSIAEIKPFVTEVVDPSAHLMSDQLAAYQVIGRQFASHDWVHHGEKEFVRGEAHNNTAESYNAVLERAKQGVYHFFSPEHLHRYVDEVAFRWNQRDPQEVTVQRGKNQGLRKIIMKPREVLNQLSNLLRNAVGCQIRRTANSGIRILHEDSLSFGL